MSPKKEYVCECGKSLSTKSALNRHKKRKVCAAKSSEAEFQLIRKCDVGSTVALSESSLSVRMCAHERILENLVKQVKELKAQLAATNGNMSIHNNISVTNNTHNTVIQIYGYGEVPRELYPDKSTVVQMLKQPTTCLPKYLKLRYFDIPETKCIHLPSKHSQIVKLKIGDSWTTRGRKSFVGTLVNDSIEDLLHDQEYNGSLMRKQGFRDFDLWVKNVTNKYNEKPPPPHRKQAEANVDKMISDGETENFENLCDMDKWEEDGGLSWGDD